MTRENQFVRGINRRRFLRRLGGVAMGCLSGSWLSAAGALAGGNRVRHARVLADLHAHPLLNEVNRHTPIGQSMPVLAGAIKSGLNPTRVDWKESWEAGVDLLSVAHLNPLDEFATMPADPSPDAARHLLAMMDDLEWEVTYGDARKYAVMVRNREEVAHWTSIDKEDPRYRICVVHSVEGGHALSGCPSLLEELADRGVFSILITHFFTKGVASSPNALPFFPDAGSADPKLGLSTYGKLLVQQMHECGIIVDATHASHTAVREILDTEPKDRPIIASHSGSETMSNHPYNLPDDLVVEIAGRGGLIGMPIYPYMMGNFRDPHLAEKAGFARPLTATLRYLWQLLDRNRAYLPAGSSPHHFLAIGSDFGGFIPTPGGITNPGEMDLVRAAIARVFVGVQEPELTERVESIVAGNVLRFMGEHWHSRSRS